MAGGEEGPHCGWEQALVGAPQAVQLPVPPRPTKTATRYLVFFRVVDNNVIRSFRLALIRMTHRTKRWSNEDLCVCRITCFRCKEHWEDHGTRNPAQQPTASLLYRAHACAVPPAAAYVAPTSRPQAREPAVSNTRMHLTPRSGGAPSDS